MYAAAWGFHVVIALGALGLMRLHRYLGPWDAVTLAALLAYYTALFTVFPASERFRFPLMPSFAVFAGLRAAQCGQRCAGQGSDEATLQVLLSSGGGSRSGPCNGAIDRLSPLHIEHLQC